MVRLRISIIVAAGIAVFAAQPAAAQFFFKAPKTESQPVTGAEPGITGPQLPGATPAELRAALVWNLRAALNVAALQCQFEPTLLTVETYNALIKDHAAELKKSYDVLSKYFIRNAKTPKIGQNEFDRFGTRVYSGFSTIQAQFTFCMTASRIGRRALFTKPGQLGDLAMERMLELRSSLVPGGEQMFPWGAWFAAPLNLPPFDNPQCWRKDGGYDVTKCGPWTPPS